MGKFFCPLKEVPSLGFTQVTLILGVFWSVLNFCSRTHIFINQQQCFVGDQGYPGPRGRERRSRSVHVHTEHLTEEPPTCC